MSCRVLEAAEVVPEVSVLLIWDWAIQREPLRYEVIRIVPHIWVPMDIVDRNNHVLPLWNFIASCKQCWHICHPDLDL